MKDNLRLRHSRITWFRWQCRAAAAACGLVALVVVLRGSSRPIVLNQSLPSLLAIVLAAVVASALGVVSFLAQCKVHRVLAGTLRWRRAMPISPISNVAFASALAFAVLCQLVVVFKLWRANRVPFDDQGDYLLIARQVHDNWGAAGIWSALYRGEFLESNRNPLYLSVLAADPGFDFGKAVSCVFAVAVTILAATLARVLDGPLTGSIAALLVCVCLALNHSGGLVACETMLCFLVLGAWGMLFVQCRWRWIRAIGFGSAIGIAFLAKASALWLLFATLSLVLFDWRRPRCLRTLDAGMMFVSFAVVASPVLVRNIRAYGNPIHSFNNKMLFADNFNEGIARADLGTIGNARRFWSEHSAKTIVVDRLLSGLAIEAFVMLRVLGPAPLESSRAVIGFVLAALAVFYCVPIRGTRGTRVFMSHDRVLLAWAFVFWVFFAWYQPIASGDRFVLPLAAPILIRAACSIVKTTVFIVGRRRATSVAISIGVAYAVLSATAMLLFGDAASYFPTRAGLPVVQ